MTNRTDYSDKPLPPWPVGPFVVKLDWGKRQEEQRRNLTNNGYRMPSPDTTGR